MLLLELNCHNFVPMHPHVVHHDTIEFALPSDAYTAMAILNLILIPSLPFPVDSVCSISVVDFVVRFPLTVFLWIPIDAPCGVWRVECVPPDDGDWAVMSAECTCGLLIYILVNLITVGVCDPTISSVLRILLYISHP